jgi:hypothetical protein
VPGGEQTGGIVAPGRGENDRGFRIIDELFETPQQMGIDDVRKLSRIRRSPAIEHTVNVNENHPHRLGPRI